MREVGGARLDGGALGDLGVGAPGEDLGLPVHAGVAEPALGRGDEPTGDDGSAGAGELAQDELGGPGGVLPGELGALGGEVVFSEDVADRREHVARGDFRGGGELRDRELPDRARGAAGSPVDEREGRVRRAEVNPDEVAAQRLLGLGQMSSLENAFIKRRSRASAAGTRAARERA